MQIKAFLFLLIICLGCSSPTMEDVINPILEQTQQQLNAESFFVAERAETYRDGMLNTLYIEFNNVKGVNVMNGKVKKDLKLMAAQLKAKIEGSDRIIKYKIKLLMDPNMPQTGFSFSEKGFTFSSKDL